MVVSIGTTMGEVGWSWVVVAVGVGSEGDGDSESTDSADDCVGWMGEELRVVVDDDEMV
jgi:hypothetical protein